MNTYTFLVLGWMGLGLLTFFYLLRQSAPYGRHNRPGWGPQIPNRLAWVLMEFWVLVVLYGVLWWQEVFPNGPAAWMLLLFTLHYLNRSLVFPFQLKTKGKGMPWLIMVSAIAFNTANGAILGFYFATFSYASGWYFHPLFLLGNGLFFLGAGVNIWSDQYLIGLRKPGETGYKLPNGGLFRFMSCPNLLGEMVEWFGFALMLWELAGWSFWLWTLANLIPRALAHHGWYKENFPNYPQKRGAFWINFGK